VGHLAPVAASLPRHVAAIIKLTHYRKCKKWDMSRSIIKGGVRIGDSGFGFRISRSALVSVKLSRFDNQFLAYDWTA